MHHLPQPLIDSLQHINGFDEEAFIEAHEIGEVVTSVRLNTQKHPHSLSLPVESVVPWCPAGRYLTKRPSFTFDPIFHGGAYYVQEASSMFIDYVVKQLFPTDTEPAAVLDLCGAPGGKSTLLAAALPNSFIVSNEVIKTRVGILAENITKWGSTHVLVTNNDPKDFGRLPGFFSLMVVDAPCSGSGLFKKDRSAIDEWSEQNVHLCCMRQKRILADAIPALQENGYLIYSTCSYSQSENEDVCDWIMDQFQLTPVAITFDTSWGMVETFSEKHIAPGLRFFPDKVKGEGFFLAVFRQNNAVDPYANHARITSVSKLEKQMVEPWVLKPDEMFFYKHREMVMAMPTKFETLAATIHNKLYCRKSGLAVGTIKGKDFIPHHELALSGRVHENVNQVELNESEALMYLRRQDLKFPNASKGWTLVKHQNINLGWMKVLPNRINNYYPTEWRILKP